MWVELYAMLISASSVAAAFHFARHANLLLSAGFLFAVFLGQLGVGLVGVAAGLTFNFKKWNIQARIQAVMAVLSLSAITLWRPSGRGRILGLLEGFWMAQSTAWSGVGIGQWTWHQGAAQRTILQTFPWLKSHAAYFGVAPSFPGHLLAEMGLIGLLLWLFVLALLVWGLVHGQSRVPKWAIAFGVCFCLASAGTTPIQRILMSDRPAVTRCTKVLIHLKDDPRMLNEARQVCPDVRLVEYEGWALGKQGLNSQARSAYQRWHETFPRDEMPLRALARPIF